MNESLLEDKKSHIRNLIEKKASGKIMKIISEELKDTGDLFKFADFVGEIFLMDPDFFLDKFAKTYHNNITRLLNYQQLVEMEEYILKKFSLYESEKIVASFRGEIVRGNGKLVGRIYVTNFRIIVLGLSKSKGISMVTVSIAQKAIVKRMQKKLVKKLQSIMSQMTSVELPCFGYQYPIFGLLKIKHTGTRVNYLIRIEEETASGYIRSKKYRFIINVKRNLNPREMNAEFYPRAKEITLMIHNTIVEASKLFEV